MLRPLIFALSRSRMAERIATGAPGFRGFSRRFVAGNTQADAIEAVRRLNAASLDATVSFLGESVTSEAEVQAAVAEFTSFAAAIGENGLRSHISLKLTELGLSFDAALAERSLEAVLPAAEAEATFVRVDMEDARYTEATLDVVRRARNAHANVGVVIQANLKRSAADIEGLAKEGVPVRLVKGAYREPEEIAFQRKSDVDAEYELLLDLYLAHIAGDAWLAVATHDERMIRAAIRAAESFDRPRDRIEFQMLYGIRGELQRRLRDEGYRVRVYVPYGTHWYPYLMRRIAERPANLWFFLRNAFRR